VEKKKKEEEDAKYIVPPFWGINNVIICLWQ
jgi:hypothetical protein